MFFDEHCRRTGERASRLTLAAYLREIRRLALLTPGEEKELFASYRRGREAHRHLLGNEGAWRATMALALGERTPEAREAAGALEEIVRHSPRNGRACAAERLMRHRLALREVWAAGVEAHAERLAGELTWLAALGPVVLFAAAMGERLAPLREHLRRTARLRRELEELRAAVQAVEEGAESRRRIIEANLRLVAFKARHCRNHGVPLEDLIQEGNLGLIAAVERFDCSKELRFSTFAAFWIDRCIYRAANNHARLIRLPVHVIERLGRRDAEPPEVAPLSVISFERPAHRGTETPLKELLPSGEGDLAFEGAWSSELMAGLREWLLILPERERRILLMRFRDGTGGMTLREVGGVFGLTRARISQLEKKALQKLNASPLRGAMSELLKECD